MIRKGLHIAGALILVIFIIVTLAFTSNRAKDVFCRNIEIEFDDDDLIHINKDEIVKLVAGVDTGLFNKKLVQINAEQIENAVEKHEAIYSAEVYTVMERDSGSFEGVLAIKVNHRDPLVRIISEAGTYYLDQFGGKIPISVNYSANVLLITGNLSEVYAKKELLPFVLYIENDEFWQAQIEQIHVDDNGDLLLIPLVGEHIIEFGKVQDYQKKLQKMKAFYEQVLAKDNWNKYKTVSLKYNNQVVAKRR